MLYGPLNQAEQAELEALVDKYDLAAVLDALATVCDDKAEHLRSNWQDKAAAHVWERDYKRLIRAADSVRKGV